MRYPLSSIRKTMTIKRYQILEDVDENVNGQSHCGKW